jgi:DNA-binding FrmR family transcriptional regulator
MLCDTQLKNRIKRTKGQMQGVIDMMENDHACMDIVVQLKAIRSSIDKAIGILTTENLKQVIRDTNNISSKEVEDAINIIIKGI